MSFDLNNPHHALRAEFAKAAMQGMLANPATLQEITTHLRLRRSDLQPMDVLAQLAVAQADSLVAALHAPPNLGESQR